MLPAKKGTLFGEVLRKTGGIKNLSSIDKERQHCIESQRSGNGNQKCIYGPCYLFDPGKSVLALAQVEFSVK